MDKGSAAGVAKGWTGYILIGNTNNKLNGSDFTVTSVTEDESTGRIRKLGIDEIGSNFRVMLASPPAP
jgi:hypothetical protein